MLDTVSGGFFFGSVSNKPCSREVALQLRSAGAAPEVGECHFAFPSECFPRSSTDGMFVIGDEVSETDREAARSTLVRERKNLEGAFARGELSGFA